MQKNIKTHDFSLKALKIILKLNFPIMYCKKDNICIRNNLGSVFKKYKLLQKLK